MVLRISSQLVTSDNVHSLSLCPRHLHTTEILHILCIAGITKFPIVVPYMTDCDRSESFLSILETCAFDATIHACDIMCPTYRIPSLWSGRGVCRCYECDDELIGSNSSQLKQAVSHVTKHLGTCKVSRPNSSENAADTVTSALPAAAPRGSGGAVSKSAPKLKV